MGITPPIKDGMVRITGHHSTQRSTEDVVIKKDELYGTRKLITIVRADNGIKGEYDVFGMLDGKGFLRNDLVTALNCICAFCGENYYIRKENKDFYFDLNPRPCIMIGKLNGPLPGEAYDVGKLTVTNNLQCPWCSARFRITMGRMSRI